MTLLDPIWPVIETEHPTHCRTCKGSGLASPGNLVPIVYRHWDAEGNLLYIGVTEHFTSRQKSHASKSHWWSEVSRITTTEYETRELAEHGETQAILTERSRYNVAVTNGRFTKAQKIS